MSDAPGPNNGPVIRVLIVDDSEMARDMLSCLFLASPGFEIAGTAENGAKAVELNNRLKPDLITMDLHMPVMDGYEAVERIMAERAVPILVITSYNEADTAYQCVNLGALDVMDKPDMDCLQDEDYVEKFARDARLLAAINVIRRPMRRRGSAGKDQKFMDGPTESGSRGRPASKSRKNTETTNGPAQAGESAGRLVAIASSTGGPQALVALLSNLPPGFPAAVLIVQHLAQGFEDGLVKWLASVCPLEVALAEDGSLLAPSRVLVAPPDIHVMVAFEKTVKFSKAPPLGGHRPSASLLFDSAAMVYGDSCAGIILTGMGGDGAEALGAIKAGGGLTIAQDEATSVIYGMPKVAAELGTVDEILALSEIAPRLVGWAGGRDA